jgi:hypothetical protein
MPREFVYRYFGKVNLRDDPEFDAEDKTEIPATNSIVKRKGMGYLVDSVATINQASGITRYVVNLMSHGELPED